MIVAKRKYNTYKLEIPQ